MKNFLPSSRRKNHPLGAVAASALLALSSPLAAQTTYTWDAGGTNTSWGNATNWVGDVVPTFNTNAILVFDTNLGANDTLFTAAGRQIRGMTFGANLAATDNIFDIQTRNAINGGGASGVNLLFNGGATNASITLDDNTAGLARVRLGTGNVGAISFQTTTDLFHNASGVVLQFDANTTGAGALNKHGVGAVTFTRANSFNGLNLYGGTVVAWNQTTALGTNTVTLGETGSSSNVSLFLGSTNTYTNAITVSSGSGTRLIGNTDVTNQLAGFSAITGNATLSGGIDLAAGKDVTFAITNYVATTTDRMTVSGAVTGTGGIVKTGNGILILSASNNYSGTTDIQGGKLYLAGAGRLGSGAVTISNGANVDFATGSGQTNIVANNISGGGLILQNVAGTDTRFTGDVTSTGGMTINTGTVRIGNGTTTGSYNGAATVASGAALAFARDNAYTHSGAISGAGGVSKTAAGDVTLTASNSYSGVTTLFAGALVAGDANALGTGAITFNSAGGNSGTIRYTAASAGTDWASRIVNSSGTVRLDTAGNNVNLAGAIDSSNTNGLAKSGAGTLTLGGNNAYGGATTVSAGSLIVNGNQSGATGVLNVLTNATLGGSGTIGGATTISGIHSPGNSPGVQTFASDLTYSGTPTVEWELTDNTKTQGSPTPVFDQIVVGGNLDFSVPTTLTLNFALSGSTVDWSNGLWASNITGTNGWLVYDVAGTLSNFQNLSISVQNWADGQGDLLNTVQPDSSFALFKDGNDIYLNYAVPEPSTYALLALAAAGLGAHVVRRRRNNR